MCQVSQVRMGGVKHSPNSNGSPIKSNLLTVNPFSTWRLRVAWMYIWWVCTRAARKENPNLNPNSHDHCLLSKWKCRIHVRILICATRQKPCRKKFTFINGKKVPRNIVKMRTDKRLTGTNGHYYWQLKTSLILNDGAGAFWSAVLKDT